MRHKLHVTLALIVVSGCSLVMDTSPPDPVYTPVTGDAGTNACVHATDCDDGDPCNGVESCGANGFCVSGSAVVCPTVGCKVGQCGPDGTCVFETRDALCQDGAECTHDVCQPDGICSHATDNTLCDDGIGCTNDLCLGVIVGTATVGCYHLPQDNLCGNAVGTADCAVSVCAPSASPDDTGCALAPRVACGDAMRCNYETRECEALPDGCVGCDDGNGCNGVETCDMSAGQPACVSTPSCLLSSSSCQRTVCDQSPDAAAVVCVDVRKLDTQCLGTGVIGP